MKNTIILSNLLTAVKTAALEPIQAGRVTDKRMYQRLAELAGMESEIETKYVAEPLWQLLGWEQVKFGPEHGRPSLPDWGEIMKQPDADAIYAAAWQDCMEAARNEFGLPIGKGEIGIRRIEGSIDLQLGGDDYRKIDFLRATSARPTNPYLLEVDPAKLLLTADDSALGDGIWAVVKPETIGYEGDLGIRGETLIQNRAFIFNSERTAVVKVFKGLIKVSRNTKHEYFSPSAGYGTLHQTGYGDVIEIHPMVDAENYSPATGRVGDQNGTYSGTPEWYTHIKPGLNLRLNEAYDGARAILGGSAIGQLPANEIERVCRAVLRSSLEIRVGVRRKVAPGVDLEPFTFRAPVWAQDQFIQGRKYAIHRDPALPDGTSTWSGVCVGYTLGNFFAVPTSASPKCRLDNGEKATFGVWEQGGGDFDGDDALVMPHFTDGGVILGFNDRPAEEQAALLESSSTAGRKDAAFKKRLYADGTSRWAGQRKAAVNLGLFDYAARKVIEAHPGLAGKLMAASLKPLIQWAVDCQKRDLIKPEEPGWLRQMRGEYMMQVVKAFHNPDADLQEDKTSFKHSWDVLMDQVSSAEKLLEGDFTCDPKKQAVFASNIKWALGIVQACMGQLKATGRLQQDESGRFYPKQNLLPVNDIARFIQDRKAHIEQLGEIVDGAEVRELEELIVKYRKTRPTLARAAELLLGKFIAQQDAWDGVEYTLHLTDAQVWLKAAPLEELRRFYAQHKRAASFDQLPGIVVSGLGADFSRPVQRRVMNTRKMMFAGLMLDSGAMIVDEVTKGTRRERHGQYGHKMVANTELEVSVNGIMQVSVPGRLQELKQLMPAIETAVGKLASIYVPVSAVA
ncbi:hypothetical protein Dxin01_00212 [Deinococcus xinjiangensis]|uniref:Uncharacterized protein n=1 Tax=Deinococcus xinjiangensis TaxID=457454 RepID=A0ABP9V5G0_9DEIO